MSVRAAHPSESSAVFRVLTEIAPEIPLRLDNEERQRRIRELVDGACDSQISFVSLDDGDNVVGFLFGRTRSTDMRGISRGGLSILCVFTRTGERRPCQTRGVGRWRQVHGRHR